MQSLNVAVVDLENPWHRRLEELVLDTNSRRSKDKSGVIKLFDRPNPFGGDTIPMPPQIDIIVLDTSSTARNPDGGMQAITKWRATYASAIIIALSRDFENGELRSLLAAGADELINKRAGLDTFAAIFSGCVAQRGQQLAARDSYKGLSPSILEIAERIPSIVSSATRAVFLFGEPGVGKEYVAQLFQKSVTGKAPFISINCGGIVDGVLASTLFGHKRGSFTGAERNCRGLLEQADGGWLFLDEITSISPSAQASLLRFLESRDYLPIGASLPVEADVRIIAASNMTPNEILMKKLLRQDLMSRLLEIEIEIPPLRRRMEEFPSLVRSLMDHLRLGGLKVTEEAMEILRSYHWSIGNVRELRNCLRSMTEHSYQGFLGIRGIPSWVIKGGREKAQENLLSDRGKAGKWFSSWNFRDETLRLLGHMIRSRFQQKGKASLRRLAEEFGVSRTKLKKDLSNLVNLQIMSRAELGQCVRHDEILNP